MKKLIIERIVFVLVILACFVAYPSDASDIDKLTERQKHQITRMTNFTGVEYLQRLGCEKSVAIFINTGEWTDKYCKDNYGVLDLSKIDKAPIIFPKVSEVGDSY